MEGSFVRWQGRAIEQLGAVNNAFTALGLAILGLMGSWVTSGQTTSGWATLTLGLAGASVVFGAILAWNRLTAFRLTASVARKREKDDREGLAQLRERVDGRDKATWWLLYAQLGSFTLALVSLVVAVVMM